MTSIFICKFIEPFSLLDMKEVKVPVLLQQMDLVGETESLNVLFVNQCLILLTRERWPEGQSCCLLNLCREMTMFYIKSLQTWPPFGDSIHFPYCCQTQNWQSLIKNNLWDIQDHFCSPNRLCYQTPRLLPGTQRKVSLVLLQVLVLIKDLSPLISGVRVESIIF